MRTLLPALLTLPLLLVGCSSDDQPDRGTDKEPTAAAQQDPVAFRATKVPARLTCAGEVTGVLPDMAPADTFTDLLATLDAEYGAPQVSWLRRTVTYVREDGTAHTLVGYSRSRGDHEKQRWAVRSVERCDDAGRWRDLEPEAAEVTLTRVADCGFLAIPGRGGVWDVWQEDQRRLVRYHDLDLSRFSGEGTLAPAGERAIYTDEAGGRLTLIWDRWTSGWAYSRGKCPLEDPQPVP